MYTGTVIVALLMVCADALDTTKESKANSICAPLQVVLPEGIKSWEVTQNWKTGERIVLFPRALYERAYLAGWNETLYRYSRRGNSLEECSEVLLGHSSNTETYTGRGVLKGLHDAIDRLKKVEDELGLQESRRLASEAYVDLGIRHLEFWPKLVKSELNVKDR